MVSGGPWDFSLPVDRCVLVPRVELRLPPRWGDTGAVLWGGRLEGWEAPPSSGHPSPTKGCAGRGCVRSHSPLSPSVCVLRRCSRQDVCCGLFSRVRPLAQSRSLWSVLGVSGCRAAGGTAFVGGTCVSGAGKQPWPRGWVVPGGWRRGGSAGVHHLPNRCIGRRRRRPWTPYPS